MEPTSTKLIHIAQSLLWLGDYILFSIAHPIKKQMPKEISNILIVEYLFIGDLIASSPAIRAVKQKFPNAKVNVLVRKEMKDILLNNPNINEILAFDKEEVIAEQALIEKLKSSNYDLVVLLHPGIDIKCRRMCRILKKANIKFRIGCTKVGIREGKGSWLHRKTKPSFRLKHKIEDNLDVAKTIGIDAQDRHLEIYTTKEAEEFAAQYKKQHNLKDYIVIHAAPRHKNHEWIPERFAYVADKISKAYNCPIIFTGAKKDYDYNSSIMQIMNNKTDVINCAGTSIQEFFALIKNAKFVVSVDTGAMHIAAAFNKPIVSLFGAGTPPAVWKPWCENSICILKEKEACTSCAKQACTFAGTEREMECMKAITVEDVLNAVEEIGK
ncbi:glycosyltransferase family 9 protein [archaeon]|nr:glycosyltransferase family 9 protein [archaeon]